MPYAGSTYSLPPGTEATTLTPIDSSDYNTFVEDIEAAQNAARPLVAGGTGASTVITAWDALAKKGTDIATASSVNLNTATGPSISLTGTVTVTGVTLAEGSFRLVRSAAAFQITASVNLLCNGSSTVNMQVAAEDLLVFRGGAGGVVSVVKVTGASAATPTLPGLVQQLYSAPYNLGLAAAVAANALTISLKGADGNDPSVNNPVIIPFRNVTLGTGTPSYLTITAATSLVISSGSTMGFTSAVPGRLWIVGFNDAGTFRLGAVNCLSGTSIMPLSNGIGSSTAEGGGGAADSAQTIYTGTAVNSKAFVVLGYLEATEATAGTWATAPSKLQLFRPGDPMPGDVVQLQRNQTGAVATGSTAIPADDTIPQNTEGDQYMSQAITPVSAINLLRIEHYGIFTNGGSSESDVSVALFQDATAGALAGSFGGRNASGGSMGSAFLRHLMRAGTTISTTFKIRAGSATSTTTFNGSAGTRLYGGVLASSLEVTEIMA